MEIGQAWKLFKLLLIIFIGFQNSTIVIFWATDQQDSIPNPVCSHDRKDFRTEQELKTGARQLLAQDHQSFLTV